MARLVIEIGKGREAEAQLNAIKEAMARVGGSATILNGDLKKLERQNSAVEQRFRSLAASLDPAIAKSNALAKATQTLSRALQTGVINQQEHDRLLGLAQQKYAANASGLNALAGSVGKVAAQFLGWTSILAAAGAALRSTVSAAAEAEQASVRLATAVRLKGDAYGITTGRLSALATELEGVTRFEDEAIQQAEAILLRFDSIDGANIEEVTRLTLSFAEATGQTAPAAAAALAKALEAPGENLRALKDAGIVLDDQQKKMISTLVDTGRAAEAQAALIDILQQKIGPLAQELGATSSGALTQFTHALGNLAEAVGKPQLDALATAANLVTAALQPLNQEMGNSESGLGEFLRRVFEMASPVNLLTGIINNLGTAFGALGDEAAKADPGKALVQVVNHRPELQKLREELQKIEAQNADDAMDRASRAMFEAEDKAKKLAEELAKVRENLVAISNIEKLDVPIPTPSAPYLTPSGQAVPEGLTDTYREYLDMVGQGETVETRLNDLRNAGLITQEQVNAALAFQNELTLDAADNVSDLEKEWQAFQEQVRENFIRGVQESLSSFFEEVLSDGEASLEDLFDSLKKMLFKVLADYLAQWGITLAKAKAMQMSSGVSGTGPVASGTDYSSMLSSAGGGAMGYVALFAAVYALGKSYFDKKHGESMGFGTQFKWDYATGTATVVEGASKASQAISDAMRNLLDAFRTSTGAWVTGMDSVTIMASRDGKKFAVKMQDVAIGTFSSMQEAIVAAFASVMSSAELSKSLDPAIGQVLKYAGTREGAAQFETPEALMQAIDLIQQLSAMGSGLSDTAQALQGVWTGFQSLEERLRSLGVSVTDSARLAGNALVDQLTSARDSITGRQRTAAEEMALRQQEAAVFNAQVALVRSELELRKYELEQRLALLSGLSGQGGLGGGGTSGGGRGQTEHPTDSVAEAMGEGGIGGIVASALSAQVEMYGVWAEATTQTTANALSAQVAMSGAAANAISAQAQAILQQIAAIDAILKNLPAPIDPKEIRVGGGRGRGGGGGFSAGPSREDRRKTVEGTLGDLAAELLPDLVAQSLALTEKFTDLRAEMVALGMDTARLDALEAEHRARLAEQAQAEVRQYTANPYQQQLAEILRWGTEMRAVYTELGLTLEEVDAAEKARLDTLGQEALAALGGPTAETVAQMQQLAQAIEFLRAHAAELGLTAEQVGEAMAEAGSMMAASLIDSLLQFVDDEDARMALEQMRFQLEVANMQLQFQMLQALGLLTAEQIALIQGLIDQLPETPPTLGGGDTGGGFTGGGGGGPREVGGGKADEMDKLRRSIDRLREFYESLYQNETISPLSLADRLALAAQEYADTLALAQAGDADAIEALPDIAAQYLELAAQMYGTSTLAYQAIFEQVAQDVQDLIGALEETDDWADLRDRLGDFHFQFSRMVHDLDVIADEGGPPPIGGMPPPEGGAEPATLQGLASTFGATARGGAMVYRQVPGLPPNVVVYQPQPAAAGGDHAAIAGLTREIDRLGQKLERALAKLSDRQISAGELRARAAGNRR